jgi:multisubunit Na+/H+ antiporter MnhC subunit
VTTATVWVLAAASMFGIGLYALIVARHLLRQLIAVKVMGSAVFMLLVVAAGPVDGALDAIPLALVLTGIIVAVSAIGFALALVVRLAEATGSISLDDDGGPMIAEALAGLVFLPLLAACAAAVLPRRMLLLPALLGLLPLPLLLAPIVAEVARGGEILMPVAGFDRPLGIVWRVDPLAAVLLGLNAVIGIGVGAHAAVGRRPREAGRRFWPLWLLLIAALNALLLSADLFNLFVTLELVTLSAIGLLVLEGKPAALRAAMRYLLLALLGSLAYLLGVALVYGEAGTLDLYQAGEVLDATLLPVTALVLMTVGLLLKSAIFPLHGWLPGAHGNAPGPVSAVLSAMVVKARCTSCGASGSGWRPTGRWAGRPPCSGRSAPPRSSTVRPWRCCRCG